jgi:hypothetical protein
MSTEMIAQVLRFSNPLLTRPQKNLLLVLAYHTNHATGLAFPGHRLLSQELLVTERQVKHLVRRVVKAGWVEVRPGQGRGHLSVYRLTLPPDDVIHRKGEVSAASAPEKRGNRAPEKGKSAAPPYKEVEPQERKEAPVRSHETEEAETRIWDCEADMQHVHALVATFLGRGPHKEDPIAP